MKVYIVFMFYGYGERSEPLYAASSLEKAAGYVLTKIDKGFRSDVEIKEMEVDE